MSDSNNNQQQDDHNVTDKNKDSDHETEDDERDKNQQDDQNMENAEEQNSENIRKEQNLIEENQQQTVDDQVDLDENLRSPNDTILTSENYLTFPFAILRRLAASQLNLRFTKTPKAKHLRRTVAAMLSNPDASSSEDDQKHENDNQGYSRDPKVAAGGKSQVQETPGNINQIIDEDDELVDDEFVQENQALNKNAPAFEPGRGTGKSQASKPEQDNDPASAILLLANQLSDMKDAIDNTLRAQERTHREQIDQIRGQFLSLQDTLQHQDQVMLQTEIQRQRQQQQHQQIQEQRDMETARLQAEIAEKQQHLQRLQHGLPSLPISSAAPALAGQDLRTTTSVPSNTAPVQSVTGHALVPTDDRRRVDQTTMELLRISSKLSGTDDFEDWYFCTDCCTNHAFGHGLLCYVDLLLVNQEMKQQ